MRPDTGRKWPVNAYNRFINNTSFNFLTNGSTSRIIKNPELKKMGQTDNLENLYQLPNRMSFMENLGFQLAGVSTISEFRRV